MRRNLKPSEAMLWKELRKLNLNIRRQAPIGRFIPDFACHAAKVVIEVDGGIHSLPEVELRDVERQAWLESEGYRVLRFTNREVVEDLDRIVETIAAAIRGQS